MYQLKIGFQSINDEKKYRKKCRIAKEYLSHGRKNRVTTICIYNKEA